MLLNFQKYKCYYFDNYKFHYLKYIKYNNNYKINELQKNSPFEHLTKSNVIEQINLDKEFLIFLKITKKGALIYYMTFLSVYFLNLLTFVFIL